MVFMSLVTLKECNNEHEQSPLHHRRQHGKKCFTKTQRMSSVINNMTLRPFFNVALLHVVTALVTAGSLFSYIHMLSVKHSQHELFFIRSHKVNSHSECF